MIDLGPYYAGMRYAIATGGAVAATLGIISSVDAASLTSALNDIGDGVKLIMKGGGTIALIVAPIWGVVRSKLSSKVADVQTAAPAQLATAVAQIRPAEMVAAVNALPAVAGVVTLPTRAGSELANSIPSPTVMTAGTPEANQLARSGAVT